MVKPAPYGPFPCVPLPKRPRIQWPDGAQIAVWVVVNLEFFRLDQPVPGGHGKVPDVVAWSKRDYGNRVGVYRLMEVMERAGFPGTANINAEMCEFHPEVLVEAKRLGWEFMAHGGSNSRPMHHLSPEDERREIRQSIAAVGKAWGQKPKGWMGPGMHESWQTLDVLAEEGMLYNADWINDDQPYLMNINGHTMVQVPYGEQPHDKGAYERLGYKPWEFERMVRDQFDVLYREGEKTGKVLIVALHPFVSGVPHRLQAVENIFSYINAKPNVWKATGAQIAEHFLKSGATF